MCVCVCQICRLPNAVWQKGFSSCAPFENFEPVNCLHQKQQLFLKTSDQFFQDWRHNFRLDLCERLINSNCIWIGSELSNSVILLANTYFFTLVIIICLLQNWNGKMSIECRLKGCLFMTSWLNGFVTRVIVNTRCRDQNEQNICDVLNGLPLLQKEELKKI